MVPLKDKKGIKITNVFQKILDESRRKANIPGGKPNKIWVDKGSEFHNRSVKLWLKDNDMKMYSTHNEGKSIDNTYWTKSINIWLQYRKMCILIN